MYKDKNRAKEAKRRYYIKNKERIIAQICAKTVHPKIQLMCIVCGTLFLGRKKTRCCSEDCRKKKQLQSIVQWNKDNKEHLARYRSEWSKRKMTEIEFKLRSYLRSRLTKAVARNQKNGSAVRDLGCSIDELKNHLESKFQPGMTWDNWSKDGWHIDHIEALANFNLIDPEQLKKACHYTNLQPLWAKDNLRKGKKRYADDNE